MKTRYKLLLGLLAIFIIVAFVISSDSSGGSSFSVKPTGTKAFYQLLEQQGAKADRWFRPLDQLPDETTLMIINPQEFADADTLDKWLQQGNEAVYFAGADSETHSIFKQFGIHPLPFGIGESGFHFGLDTDVQVNCTAAGDVTSVCQGVRKISTPAAISLLPPADAYVLSGDSATSHVFALRRGKGTIWIFSGIKPITNEYIDQQDNLRLLYQIVTRKKQILFDEFHHGYTAPPSDLESRLAWQHVSTFLWILCAWVILGTASRFVRFGPPVSDPPDTPSVGADFAAVLGLVYAENNAGSMLKKYVKSWRTRLEKSLSVGHKLSDEDALHELLERQLISVQQQHSMRDALKTLNAATDSGKVEQKGITVSVQTLESVLPPQPPKSRTKSRTESRTESRI